MVSNRQSSDVNIRGGMSETAIVTCTVLDIRPVNQGRLVATAEVEFDFDGILFALDGVQVIRPKEPGSRHEIVAVRLPRYRASNGEWRQAIRLPLEVESVLGDVVMAKCVDLGIANSRQTLLAGK